MRGGALPLITMRGGDTSMGNAISAYPSGMVNSSNSSMRRSPSCFYRRRIIISYDYSREVGYLWSSHISRLHSDYLRNDYELISCMDHRFPSPGICFRNISFRQYTTTKVSDSSIVVVSHSYIASLFGRKTLSRHNMINVPE